MRLKILYEDDDLLVVHKPSGFPVQTKGIGSADCVSELKNYLKKDKEPYLGIVHRLDQPVEGIMVFAKTPKAAADLSRQVSHEDDSGMVKCYEAIVYGGMPDVEGDLTHYLQKDSKTNTSHVTEDMKNGKLSRLHYKVMDSDEQTQKLFIQLYTGRHHQIRVQLAASGAPILGDKKYGTKESQEYTEGKRIRNVQLKAVHLEFEHPKTGELMKWTL